MMCSCLSGLDSDCVSSLCTSAIWCCSGWIDRDDSIRRDVVASWAPYLPKLRRYKNTSKTNQKYFLRRYDWSPRASLTCKMFLLSKPLMFDDSE